MSGLPAASVVAAARSHLGTPWKHQGRVPGLALDCAGLIIVVARELGLVPADFDIGGYPSSPSGELLSVCQQHMQPIADLELGCVIVLAIAEAPQHLAIVGDYLHGGPSVIHAASAAGKVVETRLMWARNFTMRGLFRLPGIEPGIGFGSF